MLLLGANSPDNLAQWALVCAVVLLTIYVALRPKGKKKDPMQDSGPRFSLAQQRTVEQQMQHLLVELSEMARQISAQLDTRATKLELLIQEADEKIAALRQASEPPPTTNTAPNKDRVLTLPQRATPPGQVHETEPTAAEPTAGPTLKLVPQSQPAPPAPASRGAAVRHGDVYALADQGRSIPEIARQLGRPQGEIELILALRPRPAAS